MCLGHRVETAPAGQLFGNPPHPYAKALLAAIPVPDIDYPMSGIIQGGAASPISPKPGRRFANRCAHATEACRGRETGLEEGTPGHFVKCPLYGNTDA